MDLPIGSIVMFTGNGMSVGWYVCDGGTYAGIVTPNLVGAFPKGVPAAGTLGVTGGATTHVHTNSNTGYADHGHAATSANTGGFDGNPVSDIWAGGSDAGVNTHTHPISEGAVSGQASHAHTVPNTDAASSLPPNISLRYFMRCE